MSTLPQSIQTLIDELGKLPGIGPKTAARLTFYLLTKPEEELRRFGEAVKGLKLNLLTCKRCYNFADRPICQICHDPKRHHQKLLVVEESLDILALEKTNFDGVYHVLGGVISPIDGIGPEHLRIQSLLDRLAEKATPIEEVILATDPSLEGEATAMYIASEIAKLKKAGTIKENMLVTRIARGLPVGGDLEFADFVTLTRALEGRQRY